MKKIVFATLFACTLHLSAQNESQSQADSTPLELRKKIFIYNASKQYNDLVVNRMALYSLLAENPNNFALRDSLALLYLQQQQYASAALVAQEVADLVPDNMFATEIAATALERLGAKNRALTYYEKLSLNMTNNLNYLYKIAFLQYDLKLYEEALANSLLIQGKEESKETMLVFPTADQQGQEVSMRLACIRLMGMVEELRDNKDKAKQHYEAVLKEVPEFEIVKQQLEDLNK